MALSLRSLGPMILKCFQTSQVFTPSILSQTVRHKWADNRMKKDYKKRLAIKTDGAQRMRINALRKNDVLPAELREIADAEIASMPRDGSITRIIPRCTLTSRPRGVIHKFRVSRIVFRNLADYNKLYGMQRAMW